MMVRKPLHFVLLVSVLGLAGCGNSARDSEMEARIAAVEAKAEAADKRARRAETMASQQPPPQNMDPNHEPEFETGPEGQEDTAVSDSTSEDPRFDNEVAVPEPVPMPVAISNGSA